MVGGSELTDPVAYSGWWLVLAVALPLLVVCWYVGITWWSRDVRLPSGSRRDALTSVRREHLERLDRVEAAVAAGTLSLRSAHQSISDIVRSFVARAGDVDARTMALEQLRVATPGPVVDVIALVYPPAFQPGDQGRPAERLARALTQARAVVNGWVP
jgi:hypothetical protein